MNQIKFYDLVSLIDDIRQDERRSSVIFGCDCGCGGEFFTYEEWDDMCERADKAREKLEKIGVVFNESDQ